MNKKGKFTTKGKSILRKNSINNMEEFFADTQIENNLDRKQRIHLLNIEEIKDNPYQPRKYFNEAALSELSESIKQKGIIQPIVVREEDGIIYLVAGERRLKASEQAGLDSIPAIFTEGNPLEIALIENLQRENLKPIEEAEAFLRMIIEFNYTQEQLAHVIGKGRTTITEILSLTKLPETVKEQCRQADIPKRTLVEIAKQKSETDMIKLFNRIVKNRLKSDQVRNITRKKSNQNNTNETLKEIRHISNSLKKLDIRAISNDEYLQIVKEIKLLKKIVDTLLS